MLEGFSEGLRRRRARREAKALVRHARRQLRRHGYRVPKEAAADIRQAADVLEEAAARNDHDAICDGLVKLDDLADRNLAFARKSTFREYADSIAVAVLIALFLRAFVVEAFKIPSGSMIPTLAVGDHIFVSKFIYGLSIPFTNKKIFEWRKPHRGEVIVFVYPKDKSKDFIKRVIGVAGDWVRVDHNQVYIDNKPVPRKVLPGLFPYWDYLEDLGQWRRKTAIRAVETLGGETYTTMADPSGARADFPDPYDLASTERATGMTCTLEGCLVPKGRVFVLGDNRDNSHDSRYWGTVPLDYIKGKALIVWWSSGGPEGVRWNRLGKLIN